MDMFAAEESNIMDEKLRAWWSHKQGLDGSLAGAPPSEVLARSGWSRSVGGSGPYLTLFARAGTSREEADAAVAALDIHELPSARGCTYVLPADDFAVALTVSQGFADDAQIATARKYLGVTDDEVDSLGEAVVATLADKALDPAALKKALGENVRNLGDEGKKRGVTTTLPLALGKLQTAGRIRRVPVNGRLDQQRYAYTLWETNPVAAAGMSRDAAFARLAELYFRCIGPATVAQFQAFSGLGVKASKETVAALDLVPVGDGGLMILRDEAEAFAAFEAPHAPRVALISSMDSLLLHRRDLGGLMDAGDVGKRILGEKGMIEVGSLSDLSSNAIVDRGRLIGLWEYDPEAREIVWATFGAPPLGTEAAVREMEAFVRDQLGDARSFSLDSPESRKPRIEALRDTGWL
jgi:hypothetical protein